MIGRKEFERLEEWLRTVERVPIEMSVSFRKGENVNVVEHHIMLSRAESGSAKSKSSKASSRASDRSRKAKAELLRREI